MTTEFEIRTTQFFSQDVGRVANQLLENGGMVLALPDTDKRLRIYNLEGFRSQRELGEMKTVGERYKRWGIEQLKPGNLWNPPSRIKQSLIISQDEDGVGACVRLLKAEYWDPELNSFVRSVTINGVEFKWDRERDIAKYFGLQLYERSTLNFLDESNTLYIVRSGQLHNTRLEGRDNPPETSNQIIDAEEATTQLFDLLTINY